MQSRQAKKPSEERDCKMKNETLFEDATIVAEKYEISPVEYSLLDGGIVNTTLKAKTQKEAYVIQRLSKIFNEQVIDDYLKVQEKFQGTRLYVPKLIKTKDEKNFALHDGTIWRIFEYVENEPIEKNEKTIYEAAKSLAYFHKMLKNSFKPSFSIDGFHDTKRYTQRLDTLIEQNPEKTEKIESIYKYLNESITRIQLPDVSKTIIHGDPKIQNFLFRKQKVHSIIDLDTIMEANELIDIGDALRSWCKTNTNKFENDLFNAAVIGYRKINHLPYNRKMLKDSVKLITLELATRFLIDYFKEQYFEWDRKKYSTAAEHNLQRANTYMEYYDTILKSE